MGKFNRKFGGKVFSAATGHSTKSAAQEKAESFRKQGKSARVVPGDKHDEGHGAKWNVFVR